MRIIHKKIIRIFKIIAIVKIKMKKVGANLKILMLILVRIRIAKVSLRNKSNNPKYNKVVLVILKMNNLLTRLTLVVSTTKFDLKKAKLLLRSKKILQINHKTPLFKTK